MKLHSALLNMHPLQLFLLWKKIIMKYHCSLDTLVSKVHKLACCGVNKY